MCGPQGCYGLQPGPPESHRKAEPALGPLRDLEERTGHSLAVAIRLGQQNHDRQ